MGFVHLHFPAIPASGERNQRNLEVAVIHFKQLLMMHPGKVNVCRDDRYVGRFGKGLRPRSVVRDDTVPCAMVEERNAILRLARLRVA